MPRGSPLVAFFVVALALKKIALQIRFFSVLLVTWTRHFNARDTGEICSLFAPELRYDYRGHPERGFEDICGLLRRSLADRTKHYSYSLQIREIIVSGDLAVVRLVWTLKVIPVGSTDATISEEPGMDIFRQQPDGNWKIVRYIAYEN